jgi:pentatricopeptide repeat protein
MFGLTIYIMIKEPCEEGLLIEARELFEKIEKNGCSPDHFTYNTIIQGILQHNETSCIVKYIKMTVDKGFLANAIILVNLSTNQADKTLQKLFQKSGVKAF